jgi:4,5-dihydroxyphthalate decarboxylase
MKLPLTLAIGSYDHVRDLAPRGIDLTVLELPIEEITYRFTRHAEWHATELSFGKTISLLSQPDPKIVPIPVFPSRVFRHSAIYLGKSSSIKTPKDLEGKRVGVPEWAQTAGIYVRGMLAHEYGVDLRKILWFQAGVREPGRAEKVELRLPEGIKIVSESKKNLTAMLETGELDAVISARAVPGERLFANSEQLDLEYFRKTGIFPIMHVVVLRRDAYERDRWIAMNLCDAFEEAKRRSVARFLDPAVSQVPLPWIAEHAARWRDAAGDDWWPYGLKANRKTLEAFAQFSFEQGVCHRLLKVEELFAPETLARAKV